MGFETEVRADTRMRCAGERLARTQGPRHRYTPMTRRPPIVVVLGSLSRDLDLAAPALPPRPGGTVVYAARALARLGVAVRVVTRVAPADADTLVAPLHAAGVAVAWRPSRATTTYANDYRPTVERHELRAASDPLAADDVPAAWRDADVVQLGPLHHDDLRPGVAAGMRGLRGLDLQGLVRGPGGSAAVVPELDAHLAGLDVVQASVHELPIAAGDATADAFRRRHGIGELVVTRGARGAIIVGAAGTTEIAAVPVEDARNPTGAGDVFFAVYLLARRLGHELAAAGALAARAAAAHVRDGVLPPALPGLHLPA